MKILSFNAVYRLTHERCTSKKLKEIYDEKIGNSKIENAATWIPEDKNGVILVTGEDYNISGERSSESYLIASGFYGYDLAGSISLREVARKSIKGALEKRAIHIPLDGEVKRSYGENDDDL